MSTLDPFKVDPILSNENDGERDEGVITIERTKVKPPRRYKVLLHNDDYTTMEFVIYVLQKIFKKSHDESEQIMFKVHQEGIGVCGLYTFEVAEAKAGQVGRDAKANGHPLKCTFEPED